MRFFIRFRIMLRKSVIAFALVHVALTSSACVAPAPNDQNAAPSLANTAAASPPPSPSPANDTSPVLSVEQPGSLATAPSTLSTSTTPLTSPDASPTPSPEASAALLIPVAGVRHEDLRDTFTEARSGGRVHDAIDIIAPRGTPVLAVADGRVVKLFQSDPGGITIYQLANDNRTIYYYAHLDRYADGLAEGQTLRRGDTIAYVGDTGNSTPGNYHLHFSVSIVADPQRWWDGTNVNPYPLFFNR